MDNKEQLISGRGLNLVVPHKRCFCNPLHLSCKIKKNIIYKSVHLMLYLFIRSKTLNKNTLIAYSSMHFTNFKIYESNFYLSNQLPILLEYTYNVYVNPDIILFSEFWKENQLFYLLFTVVENGNDRKCCVNSCLVVQIKRVL